MTEGGDRPTILLASNQGGMPVVTLKISLAQELLRREPRALIRLATLTAAEAAAARAALPGADVESFEEHRARLPCDDIAAERDRILAAYPEAAWSEVLHAERSFFDASNLAGGTGERRVGRDYVERLLVELVRFFEDRLSPAPALIAAQTPDSLVTLVLYRVAHGLGVPIRGLSPAWITPGRVPGGFLTEDEYLHAPAMLRADAARAARPLSPEEIARADSFRGEIAAFDANAVYKAVTGVAFGRSALSPNLRRLLGYLRDNAARRDEIEYFRVDPLAKLRANLLRAWRKARAAALLGPADTAAVPQRSVFLPLHFQPEASTLVGGIHWADQAALADTVLRCLPLGWSLVVKEHPAGRGTRPVAQYRRLARHPFVVFCDAPSKAILPHVDAVVTVTGTVGVEALAFDKPVIMLGRWFWDHASLVYRPRSAEELAATLRAILVDGHYARRPDRDDAIRRFLLSYLDGLVLAMPRGEGAGAYADALLGELARQGQRDMAA